MTDFFDSVEGETFILQWAEKRENEEKILDSQLERFHNKFSSYFKDVVDKVTAKYDSDSYIQRWHKMGYEPPEHLYWFLFWYAEKYGRTATKEEYIKYGNMFTSAMFYINGFYFGRMDGQGSIIQIYKQEKY